MKIDLNNTNGTSPPATVIPEIPQSSPRPPQTLPDIISTPVPAEIKMVSFKSQLDGISNALADKNSRQQLSQRNLVDIRNEIIRFLLLRGETLAHIGRVVGLSRQRIEQIEAGMPEEVCVQRAHVRQQLNEQKQTFYQNRENQWKEVKASLERTMVDKTVRPEYLVFRNMLQRCLNPNHPNYPKYGGRGVEVCDHWNPQFSGKFAFTNFLKNMGPRPDGKTKAGRALYSIHRRDNYPLYSPEHCEWATQKEQCAKGQRRPRRDRIAQKGALTNRGHHRGRRRRERQVSH